MTLTPVEFSKFHAAVHEGKEPFKWQERLLEKIVREKRWPHILDLPTGVGKTTCIDIALYALALDADSEPEERWCPRRIAMVVDRRIVVDQAAERGRTLLRTLMTSTDPIVTAVRDQLCSLSRTGEEPLGVFTLRGGIPKDDGWARTPDQPLILASTVDQIGSRMFMQGYGVSQGMKPVHAGLLANDTLLLLDEVHLSEPFRQTLEQLAHMRERFSGNGMKTRFSHAFLSATPNASDTAPFALLDDEKDADSLLGPRLHVSKPVRFVEVDGRPALEKACVEQAKVLLERHRTVAVVVNRVASASAIERQLIESLGRDVIVSLLTGRMRPLDRDDVLCELRPAAKSARNRSEDCPKHVIVGTQCIEAGADFDFDALVTEAASLDSLRQRFGRVDRLGDHKEAEGVVVYDNRKTYKEKLKRRGEKQSLADYDPIYGKALTETAKWLDKKTSKRRPTVDFGVLALEVPTGNDLEKFLPPRPDAPTLLPAYLDLWVQTSPAPRQVPDVSLWLHGPESGPADVQVIWRADISEESLEQKSPEMARAIVAAVRPSSLEAMSLPFTVARAWLAEETAQDSLGDTEGARADAGEPTTASGRHALRWRGDKSEVISANMLKPGDTIIVPASYGGIRSGCFDASSTDPVMDRAEQANLFARAKPVFRLHPDVAATLGLPSLPLDETDEVRAALGRWAQSNELSEWKHLWIRKLSNSHRALVVPGDPGWVVIEAKRVPLTELQRVIRPEDTLENGIELTTDGDDSSCAGRAVSLSEHSSDIEILARGYATHCGLGHWLVEHIALAAWLHDIGKADRRFQIMLRRGSEIEYFKDETPWAKSAMPPGARAARKLARERSGYPGGGYYHAVQSVAMIEGQKQVINQLMVERLGNLSIESQPDLDLVLHLVASHHGECRPLAPVIIDKTPAKISLADHCSDEFGSIDFLDVPPNPDLHRLDSPLADRFWILVTKYGWHELCWLEAILRLSDHRASEKERT